MSTDPTPNGKVYVKRGINGYRLAHRDANGTVTSQHTTTRIGPLGSYSLETTWTTKGVVANTFIPDPK